MADRSLRSPQRLRGLFLLDPFQDLLGRPYDLRRDSSHLLSLELQNHGHEIHIAAPHDLSARKEKLFIAARRASVWPQAPYFSVLEQKDREASYFDFIWMRKDPPFDSDYLFATQLLSLAPKSVRVLNAPQALRDGNEKLLILNFPHWIPPTLVSACPDAIEDFSKNWRDGAVLKPLEGHAGRGILFLNSKTKKTALIQATRRGTKTVMVQKYLPRVSSGEKRIFVVDGEPLGALLKIPAARRKIANPDLGAKITATGLTASEKKMAREVGLFLKKRGVFFAGLDTISGFLTEINVTSPGLLWEWNDADGISHEKTVIDRFESWIRR